MGSRVQDFISIHLLQVSVKYRRAVATRVQCGTQGQDKDRWAGSGADLAGMHWFAPIDEKNGETLLQL